MKFRIPHREGETCERCLSILWFTSCTFQWLGLSQAKLRSFFLVCHMGDPGPGICTILCCFPGRISWMLGWKQGSQDMNQHPYGMPMSKGMALLTVPRHLPSTERTSFFLMNLFCRVQKCDEVVCVGFACTTHPALRVLALRGSSVAVL